MPTWKVIALIGTAIQAIGVAMLFKWGFPQPQLVEDEHSGDVLVTEGPVNVDERRAEFITTRIWKRLAYAALVLIMMGYALQLLAVVIAP